MKNKSYTCFLFLLLISSDVLFAQDNPMLTIPNCFPKADDSFRPDVIEEWAPSAFTYSTKLIYQNGPATNRVNLVYASDGYTVTDLAAFPAQVDKAIDYLKTVSMVTRPLPRYFKFLNVYRIDLVSKESGLSIAPAFGQPKTTVVNNALGGTHDLDRLGWVDENAAMQLFTEAQNKLGIKFHWRYAVLNDPGYYNSGSDIVCFSFNNCKEIALHEGGHGFFNLADEYYSTGTYSGGEPSEINVTVNNTGKRWAHWNGYVDQDKKCGVMGAYEGARYYSKGLYRPSSNSKMGWTSDAAPVSYNAISREKIILDIYSIVKPIDALLDTLTQKVDPDSIWLKVIDPSVIWVDWYVNGNLVKKNGGTSLKKNEIAKNPGIYKVKAHVYDEVVLHANSNNTNPDALDLVRKDLYKLQQDAQWNVKLTSTTDVSLIPSDLYHVQFYSGNGAGEFTMETQRLPKEKYMLEVTNMTGQVIYKEQLTINEMNFNKTFQLTTIPQGIYIIRLSGSAIQIHKKMMFN